VKIEKDNTSFVLDKNEEEEEKYRIFKDGAFCSSHPTLEEALMHFNLISGTCILEA